MRWVAHVDMDAFFVGVELLRRPELRGQPVVVATGTDPQARGVVMAASYEARQFGVHSALPLSIAHRRCPQAVLLPRDMELYREVSTQVMSIVHRHARVVEIAGLDEAYLDLEGDPLPKSTCRRLKHEIREETNLVCSVGLAPNKLLAKIASDLDKPDGFCVLRREQMLEAVGDRPVSLIPGVGPKTAERLERLGIRTVAELARAGDAVRSELRDRANGIDNRPVESARERKSESCEVTFPQNVSDPEVLHETLDRLAKRLATSRFSGRTVTLKIRLQPFRTYTRSRTLDAPTRDPQVIGAVARELLGRVELDAPVRLLGVGLASLERETTSTEGHQAEGDRLFAA